MRVSEPDFDRLAADYEQLLDDPLRRGFAGDSEFFIHQKCRAVLRELGRTGAPSSPRLLDVGCGLGTAMAFLGRVARVVGTDVSLPMLRMAVERGPVAVQEPFDLPFADATFDAAFAFCVYHHIDAREQSRHLRELGRVVVPGGRVLVFEHNPYNPVTRRIFARAPIDQGCHMIPPSRLRTIFHEAGLVEVHHGYLLFMPQVVWQWAGFLEPLLAWLPLGGQYYVSARRPEQR